MQRRLLPVRAVTRDALTDRDGDTIADGADNCVAVADTDQADADNDGIGDLCETSNSDGDTILDYLDNCPSVDNETQTDTDGDGFGDACDNDADNDGVADGTDNCTTVFNPDQTNTDSGAETAAAGESGDACDALTDRDGDTIADGSDNCVAVANTGQADADNDGIGDAWRPATVMVTRFWITWTTVRLLTTKPRPTPMVTGLVMRATTTRTTTVLRR